MAKKKFVIPVITTLGVLIIAVLVIAILVLPNMAVNGFKSQIQNREYRDAHLTYEKFDPEDRTKANKWMCEYISTIEEDYYADKLDYSTATGILEELMQFDAAYNEANKAGENVYLDNQSAIAFDRAKEYAVEEKWQEAYEELKNVHIKYRLYDEVSTLRSECVTNVRADAVEQINAFATSGEIDKLIAARDLALMVIPDDKEIIQTAQTHLDAFVTKMLADAKTLADSKDFSGAMDLLQYAVSMYEHQDFWSALEGYGYDSAETHCEALVAQDDLLGAVKYAKNLADADSKYDVLLKKYADVMTEKTLSEAKALAEKREFEKAISAITVVQKVYDCSEFKEAIEEYQKLAPRKLSDVHIIDQDDVKTGVSATDCFGKEYSNVITFVESYVGAKGGYAVLFLDGNYINLSGSFVGHMNLYQTAKTSFKIYGDGNLLYESSEVGKTSKPIIINVDVTGVEQLRVEFYWSGASYSFGKPGCILDASVS